MQRLCAAGLPASTTAGVIGAESKTSHSQGMEMKEFPLRFLKEDWLQVR